MIGLISKSRQIGQLKFSSQTKLLILRVVATLFLILYTYFVDFILLPVFFLILLYAISLNLLNEIVILFPFLDDGALL
jgi:hypothetical protein